MDNVLKRLPRVCGTSITKMQDTNAFYFESLRSKTLFISRSRSVLPFACLPSSQKLQSMSIPTSPLGRILG